MYQVDSSLAEVNRPGRWGRVGEVHLEKCFSILGFDVPVSWKRCDQRGELLADETYQEKRAASYSELHEIGHSIL